MLNTSNILNKTQSLGQFGKFQRILVTSKTRKYSSHSKSSDDEFLKIEFSKHFVVKLEEGL